ncbi:hypothetical protein K503DRAFT_137533 [Rhizopogon vinicolor AM-OR11-026]|uniref:Uncharacterized protein n=1 Tax=Rhizopogon vinicolor AM-OR11-026 TaxID=1314800 RepID=A0A1B7N1L0_9AGAM|nr:hypothetical protein K503DRAFT_137533 [Rhizopogon vinicolor AM-OR11-026]
MHFQLLPAILHLQNIKIISGRGRLYTMSIKLNWCFYRAAARFRIAMSSMCPDCPRSTSILMSN